MKHKEHKDRKSFKKWALLNQRVMTDDMQRKLKHKKKK